MRKICKIARRGETTLLELAIGLTAAAIVFLLITGFGGSYVGSLMNSQRSTTKDNFDLLVREVEGLIASNKKLATSNIVITLPLGSAITGFNFMSEYILRDNRKIFRPTTCVESCLCLHYSLFTLEGDDDKQREKRNSNVVCHDFGSRVYFISRVEDDKKENPDFDCNSANSFHLPDSVLGMKDYEYFLLAGTCEGTNVYPKAMYLEKTYNAKSKITYIYIASLREDEALERKRLSEK